MHVPPAEAILDSLSAEVVLLDARGRILSCNLAWQAFGAGNGIGLGRERWVGVDYLQVSRGPEGGDAARQGILDLLDGRRARFELEYPCHGPDEQRWFEMTATRLDGQGGPWVVVSHVNITSRHEVERLRRQRWSDEQAIRSGAERVRFMRGFVNELAHEVNTPMTTLLLRVQLLRGTLPEPDADALAEPLDRLRRAVRSIVTIGGALDKPAQPEAVALRDLARALTDLAPEARRRGLRITVDLPDAVVWADAGLLHECLAALAASAATTCPAGGSLALGASPVGPAVQVRLEADSAGILAGSDADLWLLSARELAQRAGLSLEESRGEARTSFALKVPRAAPGHRAGDGGPGQAPSGAAD